MQITLQQNHCTGKEMKDLYPRLIDAIDSYGHCYVPRDLRCIEIRPYHFTLFNPLQSIYGGDDRRLSLKFFVVETLGYLGGLQSKWYMDLLCRIQPKYEKFRSNNGGLSGAYGPALKESLVDIVSMFRSDRYTRQAVASIWKPGVDSMLSNNTPCTCLMQFMATEEDEGDLRLSLSVYMRSNDVNWGVAYDVPAFCVIQSAVANACQLPIGKYHHKAGSFHKYQDATDNGMPIVLNPFSAKFADLEIPTVDFSAWLPPIDSPMSMEWFIKGSEMFLSELYDELITKEGTISSFTQRMDGELGKLYTFVQNLNLAVFDRTSIFIPPPYEDMVAYWRFWLNCLNFKWSSLRNED